MKKIGIVLLIGGALLLCFSQKSRLTELKNNSETKELLAITNSLEKEESVSEFQTILETETQIKPDVYEWISRPAIRETIGLIKIDSVGIECTVNFGATTDDMINGVAGLHEQASNSTELCIIAHHMKDGSLFSKLENTVVGDRVMLDTIYGSYSYIIDSVRYVTEEEYESNNYEILTGSDLTLATCQWDSNGNKGRCVVKCTLSE